MCEHTHTHIITGVFVDKCIERLGEQRIQKEEVVYIHAYVTNAKA